MHGSNFDIAPKYRSTEVIICKMCHMSDLMRKGKKSLVNVHLLGICQSVGFDIDSNAS